MFLKASFELYTLTYKYIIKAIDISTVSGFMLSQLYNGIHYKNHFQLKVIIDLDDPNIFPHLNCKLFPETTVTKVERISTVSF